MASIIARKGKYGVGYTCLVRLKGHPTMSRTFDRESEAVRWGEDVEQALRFGSPLPGEDLPRDDKSITAAVDDYLAWTETKKGRSRHTILTDRGTGKRLKARFGAGSLRGLAREDIEEYVLDRQGVVGPASIRHDLSMLSMIYETARIRWRFANLEYPGKDVPLPAPPPNRKKVVPEMSFPQLLAECKASKNTMLYPLVMLLLNTGMRPEEAVLLRRHQIVFNELIIDLTDTKTEPRRVPLSTEILTVLAAIPPQKNTPLVFVSERIAAMDKPVRHFRRAFEQACIRAKINKPKKRDGGTAQAKSLRNNTEAAPVTLYTLRHSAATYMLMRGVDIRTVADILGHKNIGQTMKYTHMADSHKLAAVNTPGLPWKDQS